MRFSPTERIYIKELVEETKQPLITLGRVLTNCSILSDLGAVLVANSHVDIHVVYLKNTIYTTRESQNIAISKIVELLFLIRKLSKKGLILLFHDNFQLSILAGRQMDILRTKEGFNINNGEEYIKSNWEWIDKNGSILYTPFILNGGELPLHKYLSGSIFISQELRDLINNNFKSDEEIQFQKELRYTKISLWIALVGLIIATASIFGDFWKDLILGLL